MFYYISKNLQNTGVLFSGGKPKPRILASCVNGVEHPLKKRIAQEPTVRPNGCFPQRTAYSVNSPPFLHSLIIYK